MPKPPHASTTIVTFTTAAAALLAPSMSSEWLSQTSIRFAETCVLRDLVRLPPCRVTFQVVSRIWTITETGEKLQVVLDLAPGEPILSIV